jgi:hypothetical protein
MYEYCVVDESLSDYDDVVSGMEADGWEEVSSTNGATLFRKLT